MCDTLLSYLLKTLPSMNQRIIHTLVYDKKFTITCHGERENY